jgi:hypothetical protein
MELPEPLVLKSSDPMEALIERALMRAGVRYVHEVMDIAITNGLDFYLPDIDLYIEVKQFHADRISRQMGRVQNVIVAQGRPAVQRLAKMIESGGLL